MGGIIRFFKRLARACSWAKLAWNDYDYSAEPGLYMVMRKKLIGVRKEMVDGYCVHEPVNTASIERAIVLLDYIIDEEALNERFDKELDVLGDGYVFDKRDDGTAILEFNKAWTSKNQEIHDWWNEKLAAYKKELFGLICDKAEGWWD